ncbi:MAG: hypothetical protein AUG51_10585 [Acidobacteria bacterium 13_1_20CM_3_53_8]|nr:MAG: hypothetical protein AUG51_10585 [Acidobacteria bacterium 13_1_20CM_3_53_8]
MTKEGVLVPKKLLKGIKVVDIRKQNGLIVIVPLTDDPILGLGSNPIKDSGITDASENHDFYILSQMGLANAYGDDEPEYSLDLIKEPNPDYEGR